MQQKNPGKLISTLTAIQAKLNKAQDEISKEVFEGRANSGLVVVKITGKGEFLSAVIDPVLLTEDAETVGALVVAAGNHAHQLKEAFTKSKLASVSKGALPLGLSFPGLG